MHIAEDKTVLPTGKPTAEDMKQVLSEEEYQELLQHPIGTVTTLVDEPRLTLRVQIARKIYDASIRYSPPPSEIAVHLYAFPSSDFYTNKESESDVVRVYGMTMGADKIIKALVYIPSDSIVQYSMPVTLLKTVPVWNAENIKKFENRWDAAIFADPCAFTYLAP